MNFKLFQIPSMDEISGIAMSADFVVFLAKTVLKTA